MAVPLSHSLHTLRTPTNPNIQNGDWQLSQTSEQGLLQIFFWGVMILLQLLKWEDMQRTVKYLLMIAYNSYYTLITDMSYTCVCPEKLKPL